MLAIQVANVEQPMPKSRPLSGCTSEQSTHIKGPADIAKPTMNSSSIATERICSPCVPMPRCIIAPTAPSPIAICRSMAAFG